MSKPIVNVTKPRVVITGGVLGIRGLEGKSAYEIAVENGFVGTEAQWLDSLEGTAATIGVGTTTTTAPGGNASVTNVGSNTAAVFNFSIPRGTVGPKGDAATVAAGTTTTSSPGTNASVTNTGTPGAAVFNFTIPRGAVGAKGDAATVAVGATTTGAPGSSANVVNAGTSSNAVLNFTIPRGNVGATGTAATIAVGDVTTVAPGQGASVTNVGTSAAAVFDFEIPKGEKGDVGEGIRILGSLPDPTFPPSPAVGDAYLVDNPPGAPDLWVYNGSAWINAGPIQGPKWDIITASSSTGASATTKVVTTNENPGHTPTDGEVFAIQFSAGNSHHSPTLNINGTGAKSLVAPLSGSNQLNTSADRVMFVYYDGVGDVYRTFGAQRNTTYSVISVANIQNEASTSSGLITGQRADLVARKYSDNDPTLGGGAPSDVAMPTQSAVQAYAVDKSGDTMTGDLEMSESATKYRTGVEGFDVQFDPASRSLTFNFVGL